MKTLTHSAFVSLLANTPGTLFVGLDTLTDARLKKTGNTLGPVFKSTSLVGTVGANYESAVQREGERQGSDATTFQAQPMKWGTWVVENKVKANDLGKLFLRTESTPAQRKAQPAQFLGYRNATGQFLSAESVAPFLPAKRGTYTQAAVGVGDSESGEGQVMVRDYAFDSILRVRVGGEEYELVPDTL